MQKMNAGKMALTDVRAQAKTVFFHPGVACACMNFSKKAPDTVRAVPGLFFLTKLRKFFVYFLSISLYFQASGIENL